MSGDPEQEYFADGLAQEAEAHAQLALRLSPRGYGIGTAHLALAMAHFTLRNQAEALMRIRNPGLASGTDPPCLGGNAPAPAEHCCSPPAAALR